MRHSRFSSGRPTNRIPRHPGGWLSAQLAVGALAGITWLTRDDFTQTWPVLVILTLGGALCAIVYDRSGGGDDVARIGLAFILAAVIALPPTGALWVALVASVAGRGRGLTEPTGDSTRGVLALLAAVFSLEILVAVFGGATTTKAYSSIPWVVVGYLILQGLSSVPRTAFPPTSIRDDRRLRTLRVGAANVPVAWLLIRSCSELQVAESVVLIAVIVGFQSALVRLDRTILALRVSNRKIASRLGELDALRSISAETVSSLVPEHVFKAVDRGCRRMFDVDRCVIGLIDGPTGVIRAVHQSGDPVESPANGDPLSEAPFPQVVRTRRGVRLNDVRLSGIPRGSFLRRARSMMAVPLLVEDRAIGMIALSSRRPAAYDDHRLQLLLTVGQQAAMTIENARHYQMATVDALTGFFFRDYFFNRVNEEMERCQRYGGRFSLLMLDLDGFKQINDQYGHLAGDDYLREASRTIRGELRVADVACRYGGDEFCLLLPETDAAGATAIGERIRAAVRQHSLEVRGRTLTASVSIGLTVYPDCAAGSVDALVQQADEALYGAKRSGRNCVVRFAA